LFTTAIKSIKGVIPEMLLIKGHNPLILLHQAPNKDLHQRSDEASLRLATKIRTILTELAERLGPTLKEQADGDAAVKCLMK
jgi:hypothetical protein